MKTFYLTTPIYYVNDKPHIGHAYTTILADVLTRFHRNTGEDVFFLTGLDEHGQKVQQAAEKRGVDPQKHCNEMAPRFLELWENLHIQNDDFIRTTEKRHVDVVQLPTSKLSLQLGVDPPAKADGPVQLGVALLAPVMPGVNDQVNKLLGTAATTLWEDDLVWDHRLAGNALGPKTILFPRD